MLEELLYTITNLGDSAITGALAISLTGYLLAIKQTKAALAVFASFAIAASVIACGKILLYSRCDTSNKLFGLGSPSGHTAISLAVYGILAILVSSSLTGKKRIIPYLVFGSLIALIAVSRVFLHYHTTSDVIAGLAVGFAASLGAGWSFLHGEKLQCRWTSFTLITLAILGGLYGLHFPAEGIISRLAEYIHHTRAC